MVTIKGDSITLILYPGKNNHGYKDKTEVRETVKGRIVGERILPTFFKSWLEFKDGRLFEMSEEGVHHAFDKCQ